MLQILINRGVEAALRDNDNSLAATIEQSTKTLLRLSHRVRVCTFELSDGRKLPDGYGRAAEQRDMGTSVNEKSAERKRTDTTETRTEPEPGNRARYVFRHARPSAKLVPCLGARRGLVLVHAERRQPAHATRQGTGWRLRTNGVAVVAVEAKERVDPPCFPLSVSLTCGPLLTVQVHYDSVSGQAEDTRVFIVYDNTRQVRSD